VDIAPPTPAPALMPAPAPTCHNTACQERPLVQWQRRLTPVELERELALEQHRRNERYELRDTQKPPPDFGPMPTGADFLRPVMACGQHAIDIEAAALVHAADCAGPNSPILPACGCSQEAPRPARAAIERKLPAHWTTGGS
jgi:hypothetical protein